METKVNELLLKDLNCNFNDEELQKLLNRISIVKNEYVSLYNKKNQDEF
jgi:hypothetical protein